MSRIKKAAYRMRNGVALVLAMIFVLVFSALAVSMASLSGVNVQIADNQHHVNSTLSAAHSGLEIIRYHLSSITVPGNIADEDRLSYVISRLQSNLDQAGYTNISTYYLEADNTLYIRPVTLDSESTQSFTATFTAPDDDILQISVVGMNSQFRRTITVGFDYAAVGSGLFNYGIASKGPVNLIGNPDIDGVNNSNEANIYIESQNDDIALYLTGSAAIAGDIGIVNSDASVYLQGGNASIGGETGDDAIDNHVSTGVPSTEFPEPDPGYFEQYVTNSLDPSTYQSETTFENIRIPANTNPFFRSSVTLNGVIFIETPNTVTFIGNTTITGIIVGDGDMTENLGTSELRFVGSVESFPVSELPDEEQFAQIRDETGTFLMAPGFNITMGGNFNTLNGSIACNGIRFFGNAGGTINGSILNYSDAPMLFFGSNDIFFDHSDSDDMPAGFTPDRELQFQPSSYIETPS